MNRDDLAAAARISSGALSSYEKDASIPSAAALRRLTRRVAECLECDVAELWEQFGTLLEGEPTLASRRRAADDIIERFGPRRTRG